MNTGKTPEAGQEGVSEEKTLPVEKIADPTMEQLAERVEQANIDKVDKVTHEALADVMLGWKGEGKVVIMRTTHRSSSARRKAQTMACTGWQRTLGARSTLTRQSGFTCS